MENDFNKREYDRRMRGLTKAEAGALGRTEDRIFQPSTPEPDSEPETGERYTLDVEGRFGASGNHRTPPDWEAEEIAPNGSPWIEGRTVHNVTWEGELGVWVPTETWDRMMGRPASQEKRDMDWLQEAGGEWVEGEVHVIDMDHPDSVRVMRVRTGAPNFIPAILYIARPPEPEKP